MRLGYVCHGTLAQLVIYRDPTKPVDITVNFTDVQGEHQSKSMEIKAPLVLTSEPMSFGDFSLRAELDGEIQGEAHGSFIGQTLHLTGRTDIFAKVEPHEVTERETLRASPYEKCVGLVKTEIALLSKKWQGDQMQAYGQDTYWWSDAGLRSMSTLGRKGVTGFSLEEGGTVVDCCSALVVVISGPYKGKTGWLVWGTGNAGVAVSGSSGELTGAVWYPVVNSLPRKVRDVILLPPESIAKRTTQNLRNTVTAFHD
jgi:hypothetical protein